MNEDFRAMKARYEQELLQLQRPNSPPPPAVSDITAPFRVRVTAANEAIPLAGALVDIRRKSDGALLYSLTTDISGLTDTVTLPATDPTLTLQPSGEFLPISYDVRITAPGYYHVRNSGIPLYGGIATLLPVSLIPLPEFEDPDARELDYITPDNGL